MATHYETDIPGGMLGVTVTGNTVTATFDYPGIWGDRTHVAEVSSGTLEAFCQSETVTVAYEDFDGEHHAVIQFTDAITGTAYEWDVESDEVGASGWVERLPERLPTRPWWLEAARNVLRP